MKDFGRDMSATASWSGVAIGLEPHYSGRDTGLTPPVEGSPLAGLRVIEFLGLGPAPFGCLLLADLGADVIGIRRPVGGGRTNVARRSMERNRPIIDADLSQPVVRDAVKELIGSADVLVEGFRPGVMERLGLGPVPCLARRPGLVYARMTGWGQTGPLAERAGHDINFIALTGALHVAGRRGQVPAPPANLLGDFGGGGMYLVVAVLAALHERARTGVGQVLDVAVVDGVNYLTTMLHDYRAVEAWSDEAGSNRLDTGAPFYDVYRCADGRYLAVGALEDLFFERLVDLLGLDPRLCLERHDPSNWPGLRMLIADAIATKPRDEWERLSQATDACLTPVLSLGEAPANEHMVARANLVPNVDRSGYRPRLPLGYRGERPEPRDVLKRWGQIHSALLSPS